MWQNLLIVGGVIALVVLMAWCVAFTNSDVRCLYERKYRWLEDAVKYSLVNHVNYKNIKIAFAEIYEFECKDDEKLSVLEAEFYLKFKHVSKTRLLVDEEQEGFDV
jgi:hypothetical protein